MIKLLNYERKRLLRTKSFWIVLTVAAIFTVFSLLMMKNSDLFMSAIGVDMILTGEIEDVIDEPIRLLGVDALISCAGNLLITLLPMFISIFVASEFSKGTLKNVISKGYSKTKVYFSKLIACCLASTTIIAVVAIINTLLATTFWGFSEGSIVWIKLISILSVKLLSFYALVSLSVFIAMTVRSSVGAIAINIGVVQFTPALLTSIAVIIRKEINLFVKYELSTVIIRLSDYKMVEQHEITSALIISLIYIVITCIIGNIIFLRRDI